MPSSKSQRHSRVRCQLLPTLGKRCLEAIRGEEGLQGFCRWRKLGRTRPTTITHPKIEISLNPGVGKPLSEIGYNLEWNATNSKNKGGKPYHFKIRTENNGTRL